MYNGIGLQTARGSGTSGHVQKNVSYNVKKLQTKQQFLKRLQQARTNNLPAPRKANPQIIQHQRKRQIYIQKLKLKAKLQEEGLPQQQINQRLENVQKILKQKLEKGQVQTKNRDSHIMTQAKQRQYTKLTTVFGLKQGQKPGSAFDFQSQKQQRLKHLEQKRKKFTFICTHEGCQKTYDSQQRLDRHLKYKHPQSQKQIKNQPQEHKKKQQRHNDKQQKIKKQRKQKNRKQ